MANVWSGVTIDCLDTERVARFWSALLDREPGPSREGWLYLMRNTGFLLLALSTVFLLGAHGSSNALKSMFEILGTLMLVLGLWSVAWSWRPVAEKLVKA